MALQILYTLKTLMIQVVISLIRKTVSLERMNKLLSLIDLVKQWFLIDIIMIDITRQLYFIM